MAMKQRITIEQLNELTEEQMQQLREWWKPNRGDMFFYPERNLVLLVEAASDDGIESAGNLIKKLACLPLLSIGQMIEFLDPDGCTIFAFCNMIAAEPLVYEASVNGEQFYGANMCDALWEAVKQIL